MPKTRLSALAGVAIAILMTYWFGVLAATEAGAADTQIHQWNIYGFRGAEKVFNTTSYVKLVNKVNAAAVRPAVVGAQELCNAQVDYIFEQLVINGGYDGVAVWERENFGTDSRCYNRGNLLLTLVPHVPQHGILKTYTAQGDADKRSFICYRTDSPAYVGCTTHLSTNLPVAQQELVQLFNEVHGKYSPTYPRYVTGDMNLDSSDYNFTPWYANYYEADDAGQGSKQPTMHNGLVFDYIFADEDFNTGRYRAEARTDYWPESDHDYYVGFFSSTK